MSSPPPPNPSSTYGTPTPPPAPSSHNPLKRPSISSSASQPLGLNAKRPRMHPLRQTSFPTSISDPDLRGFSVGGGLGPFSATSDAGSVTGGSFTGSLGGQSSTDGGAVGVGGGVYRGKKRGRKSKAEKEREREREEAAAARGLLSSSRFGSLDRDGNGNGTSVRVGRGRGGADTIHAAGGGDEHDDDEDFDDEGAGDLLGGDEDTGKTDTEAEKKNLALLVDAFNPLQSERYDLFKRAKLRKETLRRIVNHALSQSVPASVVTTINGFTKVFAGEIIEKARTVQAEWADAFDQSARSSYEAEVAAYEAQVQAAAELERTVTSTAHLASVSATPSASTTPAPASAPAPVPASEGPVVKSEMSDTASGAPASIPSHMSPSPSLSKPTTPLPAEQGIYTSSPYSTTQSTLQPPLPRSGASSPYPQLTLSNQPNGTQNHAAPLLPKRPAEFKRPPNPHRGQLLPSHLREALRRYKRDCEGGGVGFSSLSLGNMGVKGAFTWNSGSVGGRRLFR